MKLFGRPLTRPRGRTLRSAASVLLVTTASGILFVASAHSNSETRSQTHVDLAGLVGHRQSEVKELQDSVASLKDQIAGHVPATNQQGSDTVDELSKHPVSGPGITVTLSDAPTDTVPDNVNPNDLVIHQQDIDDVMNAMWEGGAEAMTVQGVRIAPRTVVRCIGNVILVGGTSYSPPYKISAIGNVNQLRNSVETNPRVVNYQRYVARYGLGWDLKTSDNLEFPASAQDLSLRYAQVVKENG